MRNLLNAFGFMLTLEMERFRRLAITELEFEVDGEKRVADVYRPQSAHSLKETRPQDKEAKTILLIHGMSVFGHRDQRLVNLASAFASAGFTAVVPGFPSIRNLEIDIAQSDDIGKVVRAFASDPEVCARGQVGLLAPSFSAGMTLIACSKPEVQPCVSALCTIGAYAHVETVMEFLLGAEDADEYGKCIVLWNFAHMALGDHPRVFDAFKLAAEDDGFRRNGTDAALLPPHLASLSEKERELFEKLRWNADYRVAMFRELLRDESNRDKVHGLSAMAHASELKAPVALVHGKNDDVIGAQESVDLYREFQRVGVPARLCLTPLISHGDTGINLSLIKDVYELASIFGYFLDQL